VFLDKDGTLVENVPYNVDPDRIRLSPGATDGLPMLWEAGFRLVVVSNQSGVARGFFSEEQLTAVQERIYDSVAGLGVRLDGFYYCPHHPEAEVALYRKECDCRKPHPGLLLRAARELSIDLPGSWLVGDILDDVQAGRAAGCCTVLIQNGNETEWVMSPERQPHYVASDLASAARHILAACREHSCT
jgi:D,D-heptose 1,7-bisphosphate phosphatase